METCVSNDFDEKIEEVTRNFAEQMLKVKNELEAAKETNQLNMLHFNGEIKKVKTELQSTKESSKTSLEQLQRENVRLKEHLESASKNQDNIMSKIESLAHSSSKEPIYFDYTLGNHMTSTDFAIIKFDVPRAVSPTKIYDRSTGKVTIDEDGLYFFYVHGFPYEKNDGFGIYMYVDDERACQAYKEDGTRAHMSCAIVRHLKRGQTIYVKKYKKLRGGDRLNPHTGFLGFKLQ